MSSDIKTIFCLTQTQASFKWQFTRGELYYLIKTPPSLSGCIAVGGLERCSSSFKNYGFGHIQELLVNTIYNILTQNHF